MYCSRNIYWTRTRLTESAEGAAANEVERLEGILVITGWQETVQMQEKCQSCWSYPIVMLSPPMRRSIVFLTKYD